MGGVTLVIFYFMASMVQKSSTNYVVFAINILITAFLLSVLGFFAMGWGEDLVGQCTSFGNAIGGSILFTEVMSVIACLWLLCLIVLAISDIVRFGNFYFQTRSWQPIEKYSDITEFIGNSFNQKLSKKIKILVARDIEEPFSFGFISPIIVLPISLIGKGNEVHIKNILAHEVVHITYKDSLFGFLWFFFERLLFFLPGVSAARILYRRLIEYRVDAKCIKRFNLNRESYVNSLVNLAKPIGKSTLPAGVVYLSRDYVFLKSRILRIYSRSEEKFIWKVISPLIIFFLLGSQVAAASFSQTIIYAGTPNFADFKCEHPFVWKLQEQIQKEGIIKKSSTYKR